MRIWKFANKLLNKNPTIQEESSASASLPEQKYVDRDLGENEKWIKEKFIQCDDVKIQKMEFSGDPKVSVLLVYCDGLSDTKLINETVMPSLHQFLEQTNPLTLSEEELLTAWQISSLQKEKILDKLVPKVFNGDLILFFDGLTTAYTLNLANPPMRHPEEANTEISVRGPRDGFIEDLTVNIALVRKRLRTQSLAYERFVLGTRSQTKVGLLYIQDIIRPEVVEEVKKRLSTINVDTVNSSSDLEELLSESSYCLFTLFNYTGRPDFVAAALIRGRFAILVDGVPTAIIAPVNLPMLFNSAEDAHNSYLLVALGRAFRILGLLMTLFFPGLYVSFATYHPDQIPLTLLATLVMSRKGVPLPTPIETLMMLFLFELFREAGIRLPSSLGQTLAVVGGLIIGQAAISAGLTSPALLVVSATTIIAGYTLVNQSLTATVSILRIGILLLSSFLGLFGFILSIFVIVIYLANIRSFGVPYLAPFSPLNFRDFVNSIFRLPASQMKKRPNLLEPLDPTRQKDGP